MKAVIFDMDGVIIDSERLYIDLFKKLFENYNIDISDDELFSLAGLSQQKTDEFLTNKFHKSPEEIYEIMYSYVDQDTFSYTSLVMDGFYPLLKELKRQNFKLAVASSSSKKTIKSVLNELDVIDDFDLIVSGEDFVESKPDPEIYIKTCELLNVSVSESIAIEDSDYGILSAKRAGLKVIARREDRFNFKQDKADFIVDNLRDVKLVLEKFETKYNGVYKIRRKSKEFIKALFFIGKENFQENLDDADIYCLYENGEMISAILKVKDDIIDMKIKEKSDYDLLLKESSNGNIDEVR